MVQKICHPDFVAIPYHLISQDSIIRHSAKGSTWEEHKYIQRKDGTYYYPDSYEGGRHLPDGDSKDPTEGAKKTTDDLSTEDVERLAKEVIRGNFDNGQIRKELLGEAYQKIQDRVNEIMRSQKKVSSATESDVKKTEEAVKKADSGSTTKSIDLEKVYNVYREE